LELIKKTLEKYLEQAAVLHLGASLQTVSVHESINIMTLCNLYLDFQEGKRSESEITSRHFSDQVKSLKNFTRFMGQYRLVH